MPSFGCDRCGGVGSGFKTNADRPGLAPWGCIRPSTGMWAPLVGAVVRAFGPDYGKDEDFMLTRVPIAPIAPEASFTLSPRYARR
jgi:hypothetical protein